ncbi:MAG: XrtA system polysaccharide chain length determinant [Spongiibacteraceae bacterium]
MDFSQIFAYIPVIFRELLAHKFKAFLCFAVVSLTVLAVGMTWKTTFSTSATVFADNQNILKPLLAQQAAVGKIQEQIRVVRDSIYAPRLLREVVESVYEPFDSAAALEMKVNQVRSNLDISGLGGSYIKITYSDHSAEKTFDVLNAVIDRFIKESSENLRIESREAFQFIDNQVRQYKDQLLAAEEQLKQFKADNFDGRESDVDSRISGLRSYIEEMKIDLDEDRSRVEALRGQLKDENRNVARQYKSDVYRARLAELQTRIDNLLLTYQESYPDVVNLRLQMKDITAAMRESQEDESDAGANMPSQGVNPFYEELRSKLLDAEVALNARIRRMEATEQLLNDEYERRKRIASQQAELSELTRDYTVTKKIYDDMLERKEKARLSMTLSIEGQGVNYKIQEPAEYPLSPVGWRFLHFVVMGLVLGVLVPAGIAVAYVLLDPRIRFASSLTAMDLPVLVVTPHVRTAFNKRMARSDMVWLIILGILLLAVYFGLAFAHRAEII